MRMSTCAVIWGSVKLWSHIFAGCESTVHPLGDGQRKEGKSGNGARNPPSGAVHVAGSLFDRRVSDRFKVCMSMCMWRCIHIMAL